MPREDIRTATDSPKKYVDPHERPNGPWDNYELSDAAQHVHHVHKIAKNKKFMEAIKKHMEAEAEEKHESARQIDMLAKSGRVSSAQLEKMKAAKRG
jgi:hypothetical protein